MHSKGVNVPVQPGPERALFGNSTCWFCFVESCSALTTRRPDCKTAFQVLPAQLATTNIHPKAGLPCDLSCFSCIGFNVGTPSNMWSLLGPARSWHQCKKDMYKCTQLMPTGMARAISQCSPGRAIPTGSAHPHLNEHCTVTPADMWKDQPTSTTVQNYCHYMLTGRHPSRTLSSYVKVSCPANIRSKQVNAVLRTPSWKMLITQLRSEVEIRCTVTPWQPTSKFELHSRYNETAL